MIKIEDKISKANYVATEHDVELLAASHLACNEATKRADGFYLRILISRLQAQFDGVKRRKKPTKADLEAHASFLTETHTKLYQFVLKGVTTPDVTDDESLPELERRGRSLTRHSRGNFARTSASTVLGFIRAGGDVRGIDVETVTKAALRGWTRAATVPGSNQKVEALQSSVRRVATLARSLMATDPDEARNTVEECMGQLQLVLDELGVADDAPEHGATHPQMVESQVFQGSRGARFRPRTQAA